MRDFTIIAKDRLLERRIAHDLTLLSNQNVLTRTRIDSIEAILMGSRFALLKILILLLINPSVVSARIKEMHDKMITQYNIARGAN